jgi:hypothetical protein
VPKKARANLDCLVEFGGQGQRKVYETLLGLLGEGGLRGLISRVERLGYTGLPAIGGVAFAHQVVSRQSDPPEASATR